MERNPNVAGPVAVIADGEANFYTLSDRRRWLARIQFNGELMPAEQQKLADAMADALEWEPATIDPAAVSAQLTAMNEAGLRETEENDHAQD